MQHHSQFVEQGFVEHVGLAARNLPQAGGQQRFVQYSRALFHVLTLDGGEHKRAWRRGKISKKLVNYSITAIPFFVVVASN
jgi:hypothetical protein